MIQCWRIADLSNSYLNVAVQAFFRTSAQAFVFSKVVFQIRRATFICLRTWLHAGILKSEKFNFNNNTLLWYGQSSQNIMYFSEAFIVFLNSNICPHFKYLLQNSYISTYIHNTTSIFKGSRQNRKVCTQVLLLLGYQVVILRSIVIWDMNETHALVVGIVVDVASAAACVSAAETIVRALLLAYNVFYLHRTCFLGLKYSLNT